MIFFSSPQAVIAGAFAGNCPASKMLCYTDASDRMRGAGLWCSL